MTTTAVDIRLWYPAYSAACKNHDPYAFVTGVIGIPPYGAPATADFEPLEKWQDTALQKLRDGAERLSIRSGHGVGKTSFLAWLVLFGVLCLGPDSKIPIAAGSEDQLRDTIKPEIGKWRMKLPAELAQAVEITGDGVKLVHSPEESFAVFRVASKDNPQALAGFHAKALWFLVDEASAVHDGAFEVLAGALSTPGARAIMAGNPTKSSGFFHATHTLLRERWHTMKVSSTDVPRARGHIEDIEAQFGKTSNAFRTRVLGEFPTADDTTIIPLEWVEAAVGREVAPMKVQSVWGVDCARFGDDRSTIAIRRGNQLVRPIEVFRNLDTMQLCGRIMKLWDLCQVDPDGCPYGGRPHEIAIDVIGLGAGVVDRLDELLPGGIVRGVNVAESASADDKYDRLRDELWWRARLWFEKRDSSIPDDAALISELTALQYDFLSSGKLKVESKKDAKKRGLRSPDLADSFVLTFAADDRQRMAADRHRRQDYGSASPWAA